MFKSGRRLSWIHRLRELVWPKAGWQRTGLYLYHRLRRMPGSPYSIAAGFACGASVSFTPLIGLHFILAGLFAWAIRANILASAIGTAVGNPWTFPFIWLWIYRLGIWMQGIEYKGETPALSFDVLWNDPGAILLPMLLGAVPTAAVVWVVFYWPLRKAVERYQRRRQASRRMVHLVRSRRSAIGRE